MPHFEGWVALILAAGRGTRMGGPKALMSVDNRPWWEVQEHRLARAGVDRLWIISPELQRHLTALHAPLQLVLSDSSAPMFASILAGARAAGDRTGLFVLPVDVPAPHADVWPSLAAAARDAVAVPTFGGRRGHPAALSAAWAARTLRSAAPDQRLDALIAPDTTEVPVQDASVVTNLNTPADVAAWSQSRQA